MNNLNYVKNIEIENIYSGSSHATEPSHKIRKCKIVVTTLMSNKNHVKYKEVSKCFPNS